MRFVGPMTGGVAMQGEIRRGDFGFDTDRVQVRDGAGQVFPHRPLLNLRRGSGAAATIVEVDQDGMAAHDFPAGAAAGGEVERPLADALLIAEDLLLQARRLADSGAPQEAVEEILVYVAAVREGRS